MVSNYSKSEQCIEKLDICKSIAEWAITCRVPHSTITKLLHVLSPFHPELPLSSRTLLNTPNVTSVTHLETGEFCYFGIKSALSKVVSDNDSVNEILISFNVDGIPLFKSSKLQFWPILGLVKNIKQSKTFVISIFCGKSKPKPLDLFLNPFIEELTELLNTGFTNACGKYYDIKVHSFICDAPARAFLKCTKSHTGYSSCDKCVVSGEYYKNKIVMDSLTCQKRTNESFRQQIDEEHHMSHSPLVRLPIDLIETFPIDYMHNVCLGIVRKLLHIWIGGPLNVRVPNRKIKIISENLLNLKQMIPREFNRKPRSLEEISYWKATEFRTFLIYLGPLVLKDVLDVAVYENFLAFHFSISVLISEKHLQKFSLSCIKSIINIFITHSKSLYGLEFLIYNVHLVSHICDDVKLFGKLDNFSAFPFENYLGELKSLIKAPTNPLQQIHRRLMEKNLFVSIPVSPVKHLNLIMEQSSGPLIYPGRIKWKKQFTKIYFHDTVLITVSHSKADSYCSTLNGEKIIQIHNIASTASNQIYIIGKEFLEYSDFYKYPYPSSELNIFMVEKLSKIEIYPINEISGKVIVFPFRKKSLAMPIIHTL